MKADHDHAVEASTPEWVREAINGTTADGTDNPHIATDPDLEQRVLERIERTPRRKTQGP